MNLNGRLSYTGNVRGSMGASLVANVEANPAGAASEILTKIRVGDTIYKIPSGGGGGGTSDYNDLINKPKINGVGLIDNLTSNDLGLQPEINFPGDSSKFLDGDGNFTTPPTGYTPINYSTSEQDTGLKWIDGNEVYQKTYTGTVASTISIDQNIKIIEISGGLTDNNGDYYVPIQWGTGGAYAAVHQSNDGVLSINTTTDRSKYIITVKYTKS